MDHSNLLDDLAPTELLAILQAPGELLTRQETDAVVQFCRRIGGHENAIAAARMLCVLEESPQS